MIIPSIDLHKGKAVQMKRGREIMLEHDDPTALAVGFDRIGEIAVIDLDAAMDTGKNDSIVRHLCRRFTCRVGGGIRSVSRALEVLSWGAEKIIIGTSAFSKGKMNREFLTDLRGFVGSDRMIIALDCYGGEIVTHGWRHRTGIPLEKVVGEAEEFASEFLFTQVEKEGCMKGTDHNAVESLRKATRKPVTAAGGISSLDEIELISRMGVDIQLGMAIYTGKLDLGEAFIASCRWNGGLIPTVTRDESGQPLMLAYSSRESLRKILTTGKVWYYSRSRRRLWMKGEESGNIQDFIRIRMDCDRDALLVTARQKGTACHKGRYSCWGGRDFSLHELYSVLRSRVTQPVPGSYSGNLSMDEVEAKIREESEEFIRAKKKDEIIWEGADILFFILLKLARLGISPGEILAELKRRRRTPHLPLDVGQ